jgi:hypothetical protein
MTRLSRCDDAPQQMSLSWRCWMTEPARRSGGQAHFMSRSKKDIVDAAVREYIDAHRDEINAGIKAALGQLNGNRRRCCVAHDRPQRRRARRPRRPAEVAHDGPHATEPLSQHVRTLVGSVKVTLGRRLRRKDCGCLCNAPARWRDGEHRRGATWTPERVAPLSLPCGPTRTDRRAAVARSRATTGLASPHASRHPLGPCAASLLTLSER